MGADKYKKLLLEWCGYLLGMQITDENDEYFGGFRCEACPHIHGRGDNAIFPLVCAYSITEDRRYLDGAERLLVFRRALAHDDGSVQNDFSSGWKGITVFSAMTLYKTLRYYGDRLPAGMKTETEKLFLGSGQWVYDNIRPGFRANINYYCAACAVDAMLGEYSGRREYSARAEELLGYCMGLFTENGLISGEGQPHDYRTEKGCAPVDIGYYIEESLPCLIDAAEILNNENAMEKLRTYARMSLDFILPDGGIDNSFGVRNNKWTYYGSRTSDGCIGAFAKLGRTEPVFSEVSERILEMLRICTVNGGLAGGPEYGKYGQPVCVHHTICHASALADAVCNLPAEHKRIPLDCDKTALCIKHYPEVDTYRISVGPWLADVTGYDYSTYTYSNGAAHASGGTISLLYSRRTGPVIAGSVYEYKPTEINNMQIPSGVDHRTLIPRAEYCRKGRMYATCLDGNPEISVKEEEGRVFVSVRARFYNPDDKNTGDEDLYAFFTYIFSEEKVVIGGSLSRNAEGVRFVLPVIGDRIKPVSESPCETRDIFFLTGGFGAREYSYGMSESEISIELIDCDK